MDGGRNSAILPHEPLLREFVGFVWEGDWDDRIGVLVEADDAATAARVVKAIYGSGFRVSLWNETDAEMPR